jgi:hypothetical protein
MALYQEVKMGMATSHDSPFAEKHRSALLEINDE